MKFCLLSLTNLIPKSYKLISKWRAEARHFRLLCKINKFFLYFLFLNIVVFNYCPTLFAQTVKGITSGVAEPPSEPESYRTDDYRSLVPKTLKGAKVITSNDAEKLISDSSVIFIDVYPRAPQPNNLPEGTLWRDAKHSTINGAYWLPNVGYGVLSSNVETYFKTRLEMLTDHKKNRPLVFLCQRECWMSWNAAKRALSWGYTSVHWFPEGTDGWMMLGYSLKNVDPMP